MGVLKVRTGDTWEDVSGVTTNEVYVGPDDPRQGLYTNALFWWDTEADVLKVYDAKAKSWLVATDTTDYLPLAGGTLTGNLTFNGANLGVNFSGGSGVYAHTDKPLTLREGTSGAQPQIRDNGGGAARDIIDTTNGDARYLRTAASTNHDVTWGPNWSGTCQYRVNSMMVTVTMEGVGMTSDSSEPVRLEMHSYPSGVPAPWKRLWAPVDFDTGPTGAWYNPGSVEFNTDKVYINVYDNRRFGAGEQFRCSMSWAR